VSRAGRLLPSCPIRWRHPAPTAFTAGSRPVSASPPVTRPSKPHHTAKTQDVCPIHPPSVDGRNGGSSACGAGSRPESKTSTFCRRPPSSPGIWTLSAVFCRSRQEVRESTRSRRVETADSSAGVSAGPRLATGARTDSRPIDGIVSAARRSSAELFAGSPQEPVLLSLLSKTIPNRPSRG